MIAAIYPGTFDPLTFGHLNIIARASLICNRLIVGVAENSGKNPLFSLEERLEMAQQQISKMQQSGEIKQDIQVESFTGLLTDFAHKNSARMIIRGLRAVADFEYEFQMASTNRRLKPDLETIFLTAPEQQHFVASSLVKEVARYDGDISSFVPAEVQTAIAQKLKS
ncbi:MAG: pantetheine-phosphate adenylyltransferase [Candidatus Puniceispirillaceae bacterium]